VIVDLDHEAKPSPVLLRSAFGLTNAEAMVALRALQGDGLKAIAQDLSLSRPTVATHLQHIYDKTGVRRQAELVRLLLALTTSPAP
jgi:DNA-binding CsgD family transcriptional regulator